MKHTFDERDGFILHCVIRLLKALGKVKLCCADVLSSIIIHVGENCELLQSKCKWDFSKEIVYPSYH